jgi:hypothetical protein
MVEFLCLAGLLFGSFWGSAYFQDAGSTPGHLDSTPHYLRHPPQYFPPSEPYPMPKELKSLEDAAKRMDNASTSGKIATGPRDSKRAPVPAQPCMAHAIEDRPQSSVSHVLILPPHERGKRPTCDELPGHTEILRALPRLERGIPHIYEVYRDDLEFAVEKLVDRVDPPCFFPLIGLAQLHHCHWKCTVSYTETVESSCPFPFRVHKKRAEVVYIDKDHVHLCADPSADASPNASPGNCAGGRFRGKEASNSAVQCKNAQQVQLEVLIAHVNKSALPKLACPWAENQKGSGGANTSIGILKDREKFLGVLQGLHRDGLAKIPSESMGTIPAGKPFTIMHGIEGPVTTSAGPGAPSVTHQAIRTEVAILPTVKANGNVHLQVTPEITDLIWNSSAKTAPVVKNGLQIFVAEMKAGQTLAIGDLTDNDVRDTVILVTARLVERCNENLSEPSQVRNSVECPRSVTADHLVTLPPCEVETVPSPIMEAPKKMTLGEIVQLSKHTGTEDIIIRQIELTNSVFKLTTQNLIDLLEQGVNIRVIRAMQDSPDRTQAESRCLPSMRLR